MKAMKNSNKVPIKQKRQKRMSHGKNDLSLSLARNNLLNNRSRIFSFSSSDFIKIISIAIYQVGTTCFTNYNEINASLKFV